MSKYYYKYVNGDKWIQINGEGDDPKNCKISWDCSKDNADMYTVMLEKSARSPLYGWFNFNDKKFINNIYAQVLKVNPVIRNGYTCKKYNVPEIEPLLPDPEIIIPDKNDVKVPKISINNKKVIINKSELIKAVSVGAESGEPGYAFTPVVYDKKVEDKTVDAMNDWVKESQKTLESEIKRFYNLD